ncbi:hypothetical protein [Clostridium sp.]|nr:hypothetical protein [Clostridium sp.]
MISKAILNMNKLLTKIIAKENKQTLRNDYYLKIAFTLYEV